MTWNFREEGEGGEGVKKKVMRELRTFEERVRRIIVATRSCRTLQQLVSLFFPLPEV